MSVEEPMTFNDLLSFIERYCATIYVRDFVNGEVGTYALAQLPAARALHHAFRWIREGIVPVRVITRQESIETMATESGDPEPPPEAEA